MSPQDYRVAVRKIAEQFLQGNGPGKKGVSASELLEMMQSNPSELRFQGFMVSAFHAYHSPEDCAAIVVSSPSQDLEPAKWRDLPPREALFAMGFELLKTDVWKEIEFLLEQESSQSHVESPPGEQLEMFE